MRKIGLMGELEEERAPLFDIVIDSVRFNTTMSDNLEDVLNTLNDPSNNNAPTNTDLEKLASDLIWDLRRYVSE